MLELIDFKGSLENSFELKWAVTDKFCHKEL